MRRFWLTSGLQLYSNNRKQLSSAVSQSHVNTVHTSYSQECHLKKIISHFKYGPTLEENEQSAWTKLKTIHYTSRMNIYTIHKWYNTALFPNAKRKVLVLFLITAQYYDHKAKHEYIHSLGMLTSIFKSSQYGSSLARTNIQSRDNKTRQNQKYETSWYIMFPHSISENTIRRFAYELLINH